MKQSTGSPREWLYPFAFFVCAGWAIWHTPAYILDFLPPAEQSLFDQISELHMRKDVTPGIGGLFGGFADWIDWLALVMMPVIFILGVRDVRIAAMEYQAGPKIDKIALFIGRITMILIISMTLVMLYEVFMRYVVEAPTKWANELTLWIAGFVFLCSGLYAMQQRCHIRIFLLYDVVPRWMQRLFDTTWALVVVVFAGFLIFGSYKQVFINKFYKWEMFGTAFDPPIPATVQPAVLVLITLIAIQTVINLIADWNAEPVVHTAADAIDQEELEALRAAAGEEGVGDLDVSRGKIQGSQMKEDK